MVIVSPGKSKGRFVLRFFMNEPDDQEFKPQLIAFPVLIATQSESRGPRRLHPLLPHLAKLRKGAYDEFLPLRLAHLYSPVPPRESNTWTPQG